MGARNTHSYKKQPFWPLMRVVGTRAFFAFFFVTFLVVAILAATNVVSKYALKSYTEDQIKRINWDAIAYQTSDISEVAKLKKELSEIEGVSSVKDTGSMKLAMGTFSHLTVEGGSTNIPWFMMIASEDPNLLPPDLRPANGETITALVGSQAMLGPYLGKIAPGHAFDIFHEDPYQRGKQTNLLSAKIGRLSMPERLEIVKYFLDKFGSATFIPDGSLILVTRKETFDQELPRIIGLVHQLSKPQPIIGNSEEGEGQSEIEEDNMASTMIIEIMHLISVDRNNIFTGWDLDASYRRATNLVSRIKSATTKTSFDGIVNSELLVTLEKMSRVSKLIGVLTVLISFPVLWLAWLFAGSLANLIILNQRRLVGLLRLRGASYAPIRTSLLVAIGLAGLSGGLSGALFGTLVPYSSYRLSGIDIPLGLLFTTIQEPWVLLTFIVLGTGFGLLAGRRVTNYMAQITPLEASRRVATSEEGEFRYRFTNLQLLCLLLGGAKMAGWIIGFSPHTEPLTTIDNLTNFVAAGLFLYGSAGLIVSRRKRLEAILGGLGSPMARELKWFAVKNMLTHPHRIMTVIMVSALTFGVVVYPQITAKSFYDKTLRALRLNLGSDMAIRFEATELAGGGVTLRPIGQYIQSVGEKLTALEAQINKIEGVRNVSAFYEFSVPGSFYIPGQNYLQLYLIEEPDQFLRKVYYEDKLGVGKPFREILQGLGKESVLVSKGFAGSMGQADSGRFGLGSGENGDIDAKVAGTIYLLPGLSEFMMQDRESLSSASIEFINSISQTHPYVVGRIDSPIFSKLQGFLANVVVHVGERGGGNNLVQELGKLRGRNLIPPFTMVNTEGVEREKLASDMFVYLALENIKVFMIGGLLVALAGLVAIAIVNFMEGKRIFALLRLRGAAPSQLIRVILVDLVAPLTVGACIGVPVGVVTGYGLTNAIFALPRAASILEILPVHLTLSWLVGAIVVGVLVFFFTSAVLLSSWIFRRTAREAL